MKNAAVSALLEGTEPVVNGIVDLQESTLLCVSVNRGILV